MYQWELDGPTDREFAGLSTLARKALAEFMDAVVLIDPAEYQHRPGEPPAALLLTPDARPHGRTYSLRNLWLIKPRGVTEEPHRCTARS
jgi:hypothetical protein